MCKRSHIIECNRPGTPTRVLAECGTLQHFQLADPKRFTRDEARREALRLAHANPGHIVSWPRASDGRNRYA